MAKGKRKSQATLSGISEDMYEEALSWYAQLDAQEEKVIAELNLKLAKLREKYDPVLKDVAEQKEKHFAIVFTYCAENKKVLFDKTRSIHTTHGVIGFRLGTPKLKTLPKWTWNMVLEKLKVLMPEYVRSEPEVNKEKLLADRSNETVAVHFSECGIVCGQDETFYIELKKEQPVVV